VPITPEGFTELLVRLHADYPNLPPVYITENGAAYDDPVISGRCDGVSHPLVGAAVYDDLSRLERAATHQRAAELLSARRASAEQIAAHLMVVPPSGQAAVVEVLQRAAAAALAKGAPDVAVDLLRERSSNHRRRPGGPRSSSSSDEPRRW